MKREAEMTSSADEDYSGAEISTFFKSKTWRQFFCLENLKVVRLNNANFTPLPRTSNSLNRFLDFRLIKRHLQVRSLTILLKSVLIPWDITRCTLRL